jgi:hypothetical protein
VLFTRCHFLQTTMKQRSTSLAIVSSTAISLSCAPAAVISVNFIESVASHPNQIIAPATVAGGGAGLAASNWNNVATGTGSASALLDTTGIATPTAISWASGGMWGDGTANANADSGIGNAQLMRGYLDDNQGAPDPIVINFTGIPYAAYDVVIYFSTDTSGDTYGTVSATDSVGTKTGATTGTKLLWSENPTVDSTNSVRIAGLTGDLRVDAPIRNNAIRHSVAGVQIIQVPEPSSFTLVAFAGAALISFRRRQPRA